MQGYIDCLKHTTPETSPVLDALHTYPSGPIDSSLVAGQIYKYDFKKQEITFDFEKGYSGTSPQTPPPCDEDEYGDDDYYNDDEYYDDYGDDVYNDIDTYNIYESISNELSREYIFSSTESFMVLDPIGICVFDDGLVAIKDICEDVHVVREGWIGLRIKYL